MERLAYYTTAEVSQMSDTSTTTTKLLAQKFSQTIATFGAKQGTEWRFDFRELSAIKYVSDNARLLKRDEAIECALFLFYGIDCNRNY